MENPIIVPFDLNTARKIKSGEIEGSVLIDNIEIEFVYESKDCAGPYNLLFVKKKDGYGISAIYANITVKLKYVEKRVLDTFTDNGIDLSNYTHCIIVKRNFYLAW